EVESIFIPFHESPEKTQEKANEAYGLIMMGKEFSEVAERFSLTPSKSTITRGKMKPEIDGQLFQLKKGDVSWPIESDRGFFLFKILKKNTGETFALKEVKDQIAAYLSNEKFREEIKKWLKEKKSKTYIEIKTP
ncbi:MAG TPA: peptidylprolyl isomerase, partial [Candidatus Bathyarchaeia archaeon]|nr:peptidylprolyl isomerase [Candidatus Bathyarchaeia archaeon]